MRKALTIYQVSVLSYIDEYIEKNNHAPSQLEIAKELDIRQGNVGKVLQLLEKKGYIEWHNYVPRGIKIIPTTQQEQDELDAQSDRYFAKLMAETEQEESSNS